MCREENSSSDGSAVSSKSLGRLLEIARPVVSGKEALRQLKLRASETLRPSQGLKQCAGSWTAQSIATLEHFAAMTLCSLPTSRRRSCQLQASMGSVNSGVAPPPPPKGRAGGLLRKLHRDPCLASRGTRAHGYTDSWRATRIVRLRCYLFEPLRGSSTLGFRRS